MSVKFEDYYQTLGVSRSASATEIQRAYRKLARQYHPDVNKDPDATGKFQRINEAYEVLKDAQKRQRYDQLGENWKAGQDFRPPPGWENFQFRSGPNGRGSNAAGAGGGGFNFQAGGQFSDFFEMLFGQAGMGAPGSGGGFEELLNQQRSRAGARHASAPAEQEAELTITLEEAFHGGSRTLQLQGPGGTKRVDVKIPAGVTDGARIRLGGEHLILTIRLAPHARYRVQEHDLEVDLPIAPWEAALGAKVELTTLDGPVTLTIPPGASSGAKLRLKQRGLKQRDGERGDLLAVLKIVLPKTLSAEERELFEQLRAQSKFNPRA